MTFWLLLIILASIAVIGGIVFLNVSPMSDNKKSKLIVLIGVLIYTALMISFFKHENILEFSFLSNGARGKLQSKFLGKMPTFKMKYKSIPIFTNLQEVYQSNYPTYPKANYDYSYSQRLIYISKHDEGSSYFIYKLAQSFKSYKIPTLYCKLDKKTIIKTPDQFARIFGIPKYQLLFSALKYYRQNNRPVYILIDYPQNLVNAIPQKLAKLDQFLQIGDLKQRKIIKQVKQKMFLEQLIDQLGLSVIMNIKQGSKNEEIMQILQDNFDIANFQVRQWTPPTKQHFFYNIPQQFSEKINKQTVVNFKEFNKMLSSQYGIQTEPDIVLAKHFNLAQPYKKLLSMPIAKVSLLRKHNITYQQIMQLANLDLLAIRQGKIFLKYSQRTQKRMQNYEL